MCQLNQFEAALIQYQKLDVKGYIDDIFALAKVFFKLGKCQPAYKSIAILEFYDFHGLTLLFLVYENGLSLCSDNEKSVVYTALGMAAFKFKLEDSITNFFKR